MKETSSEREREMGKHKLEPPASNFFAPDASHSEVLGASDSLSLPSEPPDIRNWFSSYVYQSPELNTSDDFEAHVLRGTDCVEKSLMEKRRPSRKKKIWGNSGQIEPRMKCLLGREKLQIVFRNLTMLLKIIIMETRTQIRFQVLQISFHLVQNLHILQDGFQATCMNLPYWIQVIITEVLNV
ncbi:uncharacterized protein LOC127787382 [Diospyros lotus]|uniref:uncharacterized protein LOC127787382 n=1 Tax=Diospyros lotus TaxID=55363 RepID=UPI00224DF885|nr:uncharacterized protein LOC127787382 [Diospyros lotus]